MKRKTFWKLGLRGIFGTVGFSIGYVLIKYVIFVGFPIETLNLMAGGFGGLVAMYFMFGDYIYKGVINYEKRTNNVSWAEQ